MAKKTTKAAAQAMQERNEQRATEIMTKAATMVRNAQDLIKTLERLMSEDKENVQPEAERKTVPVEVTPAPELHVVKDAYRSDNKTGYEGVYFDRSRTHSYVATVFVRGRVRRKYGFKTPEEAKVVREQMKLDLIKEIERELGPGVPVCKEHAVPKKYGSFVEREFQYDMETLSVLGRDAWIAWAKEAMMRLTTQRNNENTFPNVIRKMEKQTHSNVKLRLNWAKYHAHTDGKSMDEANQLNVYDVLANDRVLRDAFTEIVVQALSGATEAGLATEAATIKRTTKRAGVKLKEAVTGNTAAETVEAEKLKAAVKLG